MSLHVPSCNFVAKNFLVATVGRTGLSVVIVFKRIREITDKKWP
jgi:hypothetical protein